MIKDILSQYNALLIEVEDAKKKIKEIEDSMAHLNEVGMVKDKVYGGLGGTQGFVIEGFPEKAWNKRYYVLKKARQHLLEKETALLETICDIEIFIDDIEDARDRIVMKRYFLENKKQHEIASELHVDRSLVSKIICKYVEDSHNSHK